MVSEQIKEFTMAEQLKYVSPEYQERLDRLAALLVNPERYGQVATAQVIEFPVQETVENPTPPAA